MYTAKLIPNIAQWLKDYAKDACSSGYVIGISGGINSAVSAALCCQAVGRQKVLGVLMPSEKEDISKSILICEFLGIDYKTVNIQAACNELIFALSPVKTAITSNIPPRIRMATLYAIAQSMNYLVCGSVNASKKYIGTFTKWGESACDINPLAIFTSDQVEDLRKDLGIPAEILYNQIGNIAEQDLLSFNYSMVNEYITTGSCSDGETRKKILHRHQNTLHKSRTIPKFKY